MKILYTTDIHGSIEKYKKIIKLHKNYDITIIGGDILPKIRIKDCKKFIEEYLPKFFNQIKTPLIIDFANDDYMCLWGDFWKVVHIYKNVYTHHLRQFELGEIIFCGMNFVPDYPFLLKDWCRRDLENSDNFIVTQLPGKPVISTNDEFKNIPDLTKYYLNQLSLEQYLNNLAKPDNNKIIYIFHSPPKYSGLDMCYNGQEVGSLAIRDFIVKKSLENENNIIITVHGHIHESPEVTGKYFIQLTKNSISFQPGQTYHQDKLTYLELNLKRNQYLQHNLKTI